MATIEVTGTVYWDGGLPLEKSGRVDAAVIKVPSGATEPSVTTDDNGDFKITGVDDSKPLSLILLHEDAVPKKLSKKAGAFSDPLALRLPVVEGAATPRAGYWMLGACVAMLAVLTFSYLTSHKSAADLALRKNSDLITALKALPGDKAQAEKTDLRGKLAAVRQAQQALAATRSPPGAGLSDTLESIVTYELADDALTVDDLVALTDQAVDGLRNAPRRYFWTAWPWVLVELWCWGLLGVLLNKIVRIGWYLRASRYYPRGTWMHLSHIAATPFLAVVAVLILSFLKVESESQTIVDLSNPLFMVVTAFLLSTNPWPLWDFVIRQGDRVRQRGADAG